MRTVTVAAGRVQPVWAGHPWVFAQAIERVDGAPTGGDVVEVRDPRGNFLGRGFWSPGSAIPVRILTRDPEDLLDTASLARRLDRAAEWRRRELGLPSEHTTGYRLVHSEGDQLPGLVVDVFGDVAVVQLLTVGMKRREDWLFGEIARVARAKTVIEVPGGQAQKREGLSVEPRVVRGADVEELRFRERGLELRIELPIAQKTGYYFDQRDNRALVERMASGKRVLDLYAYVGSFALAAARGGAIEVQAFDSSAGAIAQGASIAAANGLGARIAFARADVRRLLGELAGAGKHFDMVIVDPPKLAPSARHLPKARTAYRKLNAGAIRLLGDGGVLVSCSCSAAMTPEELMRTVALAARDADRDATLLHMGQQGMDHPVPAAFPEGRYLKCALVRVTR